MPNACPPPNSQMRLVFIGENTLKGEGLFKIRA